MRHSGESHLVIDRPESHHLDPADVAAYADRSASWDQRARIEAHLAACAECRAEVADAARIIARLPRARRAPTVAAAATAAAVLLLLVWPRAADQPGATHREAPVTLTTAPVALSPAGSIDSLSALTWTSVPGADEYVVRIFDDQGTVVWQRETPDTLAVVETVIRRGHSYHWKVEARIGFDRSTASELVDFTVRPRRPR